MSAIKVAGKTAISRNRESKPARMLHCMDRIRGHTLDFGCGKGADALKYNMHKYDPNHHPDETMLDDTYDTVLCTYVLNTLPKAFEVIILKQIKKLLKPLGTAYITVRRGKFKQGVTKKGTYQRMVDLSTWSFCDSIYKDGTCEIYRIKGRI